MKKIKHIILAIIILINVLILSGLLLVLIQINKDSGNAIDKNIVGKDIPPGNGRLDDQAASVLS